MKTIATEIVEASGTPDEARQIAEYRFIDRTKIVYEFLARSMLALNFETGRMVVL